MISAYKFKGELKNLVYGRFDDGHPHAAAAAKLLQSCATLWPHRRQPTRLPCPWDSPGKNTGVGCHFLHQCLKVESDSEVVQLCPTLSDLMDCSLPCSSIHAIFQARVLEWVAIAFARPPIQKCKCSSHPERFSQTHPEYCLVQCLGISWPSQVEI